MDLDEYILQRDIAKRSRYSKGHISRKFKELRQEGFIKEHRGKTKTYNSMSDGRAKIFIPTLKGIEYGGLEGKFHEVTGGSAGDSVLDTFGIGLADMHGKLQIKIPIDNIPEDDGFTWKGPNELQNGVKQYIRYIYKAGDQISIEKFVGSDSQSIILKPRFISKFQDSPEDLIQRFIDVAWAIWDDLKRHGYELAFPQGPEGEAKFTLRCPAFEEIGYTEGDNILIDYSTGEAELHPTTGSLNANALMTELLLDSKTVAKKFEKQVVSEEEFVQGMEEIGEYSKMVENVKKTRKKQERIEQKTDVIAQHVGDLAESVNHLMGVIEDAQEGAEQQQSYDPPEMNNGGPMYG